MYITVGTVITILVLYNIYYNSSLQDIIIYYLSCTLKRDIPTYTLCVDA